MQSVVTEPPPPNEALTALRDRAQRLYQTGRWSESLSVHEEALALAPDAVVIRLSAARIAHALERQDTSLRHFEAAVVSDPRCYPAVEAARRICVGAGLEERAAYYTELARRLHPTPEARIALALLVPSIMDSGEAVRATRARYTEGVEALLADPPRLEAPSGELGVSAFFLAYHGDNDRDLQIKTARAFMRIIPGLEFTAPHCVRPRRAGARIRIGFISRFFAAHSIFSTSVGLIEKLARERFEVIALRIMPSRDDESTQRVRAAAERTIDLEADVYRAREQISALELDILFYQDIGMEPSSYFLAFARLAPVQCVSFGHPNTTGIPTMDYFISNDLYEPPGAEAHYSERLVRLEQLPTLAYYYQPPTPATVERHAFDLAPDGTWYVCPQTLYKFHPDFDAMLQGILERDRDGQIVLIEGQFLEFGVRLRRRFAQRMPHVAQRIRFLAFLPFPRFMQLLSLADVVLDTPHFNGMNSSLQALAAGAPVVTLPGRFQRGRHTQAMYRRMGIDECIATDAEHYVDLALRVSHDRPFREAIRRRIAERRHVLFEDPRVVEEFERFFSSAHAASTGARAPTHGAS